MAIMVRIAPRDISANKIDVNIIFSSNVKRDSMGSLMLYTSRLQPNITVHSSGRAVTP
jgi:hypothetical protein